MEAETCKQELVIEIPVDEVRKESESVTEQFRRAARIPGFRRGHAPPTLVRRHFGADIRNEVVQSLLPKFFENLVKEKKLAIVGRPRFEDLKFEEDQPLTCKATFEVLPPFELGEYKGLEVEEDSRQVSEDDVDKAVEELRQRAATYGYLNGLVRQRFLRLGHILLHFLQLLEHSHTATGHSRHSWFFFFLFINNGFSSNQK